MNSLSRAEKDKLVSAINRLIESGRYVELGNIHGGPLEANVCPGLTENITLQEGAGGCCRHDKHYLLPWHRLFIAHVEDELGEALPYWDWSVDRKVPDLWEGIKAPLYSPFTSRCQLGSSFVARNKTMNMPWDKLKKAMMTAMEAEDFDTFHSQNVRPHNAVHKFCWLRNDMDRDRSL